MQGRAAAIGRLTWMMSKAVIAAMAIAIGVLVLAEWAGVNLWTVAE